MICSPSDSPRSSVLIFFLVTASSVCVADTADRFVYPVLGLNQESRLNNIVNPTSDGWYINNYFGNAPANQPCGVAYPYHPGADLNRDDGNDAGEPVYAIADGVITRIDDLGTLGWAVIIKHDLPEAIDLSSYFLSGTMVPVQYQVTSTVSSAYIHLANVDPTVECGSTGSTVVAGQPIGTILNMASGPHLHFEMRAHHGCQTADPSHPCGYYETRQGISNFGYIDGMAFIADHLQQLLVGYYSDGWHDDGTSESFVDKYIDVHAAGHELGDPWDNGPGDEFVHEFAGLLIQDFYGPDNGYDHPWSALIIPDTSPPAEPALLLKEGFWSHWTTPPRWASYGPPITDEGPLPLHLAIRPDLQDYEVAQRFRRSDGDTSYFLWGPSASPPVLAVTDDGDRIELADIVFHAF
ncbi:M23 family metallopeptidase, partial [bacterium]|nr:M23 family metallopeptidase [bacterium]